MPTKTRFLVALLLALISASVACVLIALPRSRSHVWILVLNRTFDEVRDVRIEFYGSSLAAPKAAESMSPNEQQGYSTETTAEIPSKAVVRWTGPEGVKIVAEVYPQRVAGRRYFLEGHEMRIEINCSLQAEVLFTRNRGA